MTAQKLCAFFSLLLLLALPATATQFKPLSIRQIVEQSELIVQGTVRAKTSLRDATGRIYTRVELEVTEVWKGTLATNRCFIALGTATLGEESVMIPGEATYEIGEEVVACLVLNARREGVTLCLAHGKFRVERDAQTGEKHARNLFHGGDGPARLHVTELKRQVGQHLRP